MGDQGDMKRVVVRAPLLSISGYGEHSRQIFQWAKSIETWSVQTQVLNWGNTSWHINPDNENGLVDQIMKSSTNQSSGFDISIQVQLPNEWDPTLGKFNIGVTAAVETDRCNPEWVDAVNKMSVVIVPTEHVKKTLQTSGNVTTPIHVIGEWYMPEIDQVKDHFQLPLSTTFNFLIVSQMTSSNSLDDRKNIHDTLRWLFDVFKDDKDVGIILKTNMGRGTKIDRKITFDNIEKFVAQNRKGKYPRVHMIHGNLTSEEIAGLYRNPTIKGLISLTRGEGFGLPILEASASSVPVVVTNWSGHLDFLKQGKYVGVDYALVDIPQTRVDGKIFVAGTKWAQPNEADFKKRIVKFRSSPLVPKEWAQDLSDKCQKTFSREAILKKYASLTDALDLR
jgi:glycosyltransferase involved in cell wall biosynthesis